MQKLTTPAKLSKRKEREKTPELKPKPPAPKLGKKIEKDISKTYNEFKQFEGQQYSGMKVGRVTNGTTIRANGGKQR